MEYSSCRVSSPRLTRNEIGVGSVRESIAVIWAGLTMLDVNSLLVHSPFLRLLGNNLVELVVLGVFAWCVLYGGLLVTVLVDVVVVLALTVCSVALAQVHSLFYIPKL